MSKILWLGNANWWDAPPIPEHPEFLMALSEEAVLDVAHRTTALERNSINGAIATVSRLAMRVALAPTGLNPRWQPLHLPNGVVKASASCMHSSVRFFSSNDYYITNLAKYVPELAEFGVCEEMVLGKSIQVDGAIINNCIYFFFALEQVWDFTNTNILGIAEYRRLSDFPTGLEAAVTAAIRAIGINNTAFSAELKYTKDSDWKLIEIHSHLTDKNGISKIMWSTDALLQIEDWLDEQILSKW